MCSMSVFLFGGLAVLLGNLVLLVVCSGINDCFYACPQPSVGARPLEVHTEPFPISDFAINEVTPW